MLHAGTAASTSKWIASPPSSALKARMNRTRMMPAASTQRPSRAFIASAQVTMRRRRRRSLRDLGRRDGHRHFVAWPKVFEANRRTFLGTSMIAVRGRIQREGDVVHLVVQKVTDQAPD